MSYLDLKYWICFQTRKKSLRKDSDLIKIESVSLHPENICVQHDNIIWFQFVIFSLPLQKVSFCYHPDTLKLYSKVVLGDELYCMQTGLLTFVLQVGGSSLFT